jgi:hypothetical protein
MVVLVAFVGLLLVGAGSAEVARRAARSHPAALESVRFATVRLLGTDRALRRLPAAPPLASRLVADPGQKAIRAAAVRGTWDDSRYETRLAEVESQLLAEQTDPAATFDESRFVATQWVTVRLDGDRADVVVRGHTELRTGTGDWTPEPDASWHVALVRTEGISGSVRGWRLLAVDTAAA